MIPKKNKLTREQAEELYKDLQTTVAALRFKGAVKKPAPPKAQAKPAAKAPLKGYSAAAGANSAGNDAVAAEIAKSISRALSGDGKAARLQRSVSGQQLAVVCVIFFAAAKIVLSALEASGIGTATPAMAAMTAASQTALLAQPAGTDSGYSKEEVRILTALDARRVELEERTKKLDQRSEELDQKDREFAMRLTQLRELTDSLKNDRDKSDKKRSVQLDQLSNVYSAMDPKEAAGLIEQLDVTIALELVSRMPEKRIGQILALMNPGKALAITRMLSGK